MQHDGPERDRRYQKRVPLWTLTLSSNVMCLRR
jgi:hypothetical protein